MVLEQLKQEIYGVRIAETGYLVLEQLKQEIYGVRIAETGYIWMIEQLNKKIYG